MDNHIEYHSCGLLETVPINIFDKIFKTQHNKENFKSSCVTALFISDTEVNFCLPLFEMIKKRELAFK